MFIPYLCFRFYKMHIYSIWDNCILPYLRVQCVEVLLTYPDRMGSYFGYGSIKYYWLRNFLQQKFPQVSSITFSISFSLSFRFLWLYTFMAERRLLSRAFTTNQACTIPLKYSFVKKRIDICIKHRKRITQCFYILLTDWKVNDN